MLSLQWYVSYWPVINLTLEIFFLENQCVELSWINCACSKCRPFFTSEFVISFEYTGRNMSSNFIFVRVDIGPRSSRRRLIDAGPVSARVVVFAETNMFWYFIGNAFDMRVPRVPSIVKHKKLNSLTRSISELTLFNYGINCSMFFW